MLRGLVIAAIAAGCIAVTAADFNQTLEKAQRFYAQKEWASASAMYSLLIDERPNDTALYGRAITAEGMRGDSAARMGLMKEALAHHIPFEALFKVVERESFALGRADLYEEFLVNLRTVEPWLQRTVDARLLAYYAFRRNPQATELYAEIMLAGLPDSREYLTALAEAYVTAGDMNSAEEVFKRMVKLNPKDYDALLWLGNMAADTGRTEEARRWLERASAIRSTPYVTARLASLSSAAH